MMLAVAVTTNVLLAALGCVVLLVGLVWAAWKKMPAIGFPSFARDPSPEKQFLSDLALVLQLQSRLTDANNIPAAKLCDQIKLEMLKAPVPTAREPKREKL